MVPHPEFRRSMTAQRVEELRRSSTPSNRIFRQWFGRGLVLAGERLTAEAHAERAPRCAASAPRGEALPS
jgi:hypothetical protein